MYEALCVCMFRAVLALGTQHLPDVGTEKLSQERLLTLLAGVLLDTDLLHCGLHST